MYKELELIAAARRKGFAVHVQGDTAVVYGTHPARITHEMASLGFSYAGQEVGLHSLSGQWCTGITYPVKP